MNLNTADEIRESFLSFFESKGHLRLPSYSLVPVEDPTLLIINAGMAPMKVYFKGEAEPPRKRVTTCQKCIRVGDIEQVGRTARHLTFFEMLGNFSFGDYFKRESVIWGWEYVTRVLGIPPEKLYVTIHTDDDDAERYWMEDVGVPKDRISRLQDNFWGPVGNTGPCGPCSEILIDQGEELGCGSPDCRPGCDCDRYLEIWNLVFTGLNKNEEGKYVELPSPCIDTGLGFERVAAYFQGKKNVFETDLFRPILEKIREICGKTVKDNKKDGVHIKVIADHIRSVVFMAGDGITPSNEGRGYVMRRLIRRSVRAAEILGFGETGLTELAPAVVDNFGHIYPEIKERKDYAISIIKAEEENFKRTLSQGVSLLNDILKKLKNENTDTLPGSHMFTLYDTYGFPRELTEEISKEQGFRVDLEGYEKALNEQRERARSDTKSRLDSIAGDMDLTGYSSVFTGYDNLDEKGKILEIFIEGKKTDKSLKGDRADLILDKTCFYGESGGQVGDRGIIEGEGFKAEVLDTLSTPAGVNIHRVSVLEGAISKGAEVELKVETLRRTAIMRHHSATHLLQSALRRIIGAHVGQMGSHVDENRLRFDFSHQKALTPEEIGEVEGLVNSWILENIPLSIEESSLNDALKQGALAFFGDKYGEKVRLINIPQVSAELCGGTHVKRTGDIGSFKIISESAVGMGTRRIEAVCGMVSFNRFQKDEALIRDMGTILNTDSNSIMEALARMKENIRQLEKELKQSRSKNLSEQAVDFVDKAVVVEGIHILTHRVKDMDKEDLRKLADLLVSFKGKPAFVVLANHMEDRVSLLARISENLISKGLSAGKIIQAVSPIMGGKGGGRPHLAEGGGKDPSKIDEVLKESVNLIKQQIEGMKVKK